MNLTSVDLNSLLDLDLQHLGDTDRIYPDSSLKQVYAAQLRSSLTKKLVSAVHVDANKRALEKFLACDEACRDWKLPILDTKHEIIVNEVKAIIDDFWHKDGYSLTDSFREHFDAFRLGPGANIEARGNDFYSKLFASRLTASSSGLYQKYRECIRGIPEWQIAETIRDANMGSASCTRASRLSFVPKNDEISRCICTEPTLNTMFQLGFADSLNMRLRGLFGIDLANQQAKNRALARLASENDDLSTLDLSSASDTISHNLVRYLLPAAFLRQLEAYRTPYVDIPGRGRYQLNMFSSMGNGYTFSLQTIIFSSVVLAVLRWHGLTDRPRGYVSVKPWGVNGDDIIVPKHCASDVINVLTLFGFTVNKDKSFVEGPFRESCGGDYWKGANVRGVYLKSLVTAQDFYVAINLLIRFSTRSGIYLNNLIGRLLLECKSPHLVPVWENINEGIHVPLRLRRVKWSRKRQGYSYTKLAQVPFTRRISERSVHTPRGCKSLIYNPSGLLISFVAGKIVNSEIGMRLPPSVKPKFTTKRCHTARWDSFGSYDADSVESVRDWDR